MLSHGHSDSIEMSLGEVSALLSVVGRAVIRFSRVEGQKLFVH